MALRWFRRSSLQQQNKTTNEQAAAAATPLPSEEHATEPQADSKPSEVATETPDPKDAVISNEDEGFLEHVVSNAEEPRLPPLDASDTGEVSLAELAAAEVAKKTPLPQSPPPPEKKANRFSWASASDAFNRMPSFRRKQQLSSSATQGLTQTKEPPTQEEAEKEKKDLKNILERLKLDSDSFQTRALALSDDSRKLLNQFIQILKDIVSGAPHAYDDLDRFMKHREKQIEGLYDSLPPFLQKLVQALPTKAWQYLGPQVAAGVGAATRSDKQRAQAETQQQKRQSGRYVPPLRSLLSSRGAVATLLRSIVEFLEARFPAALAGTNVLLSLAVFILLFVFWYCYKRGREERLVVEAEEATRGRSRERQSTDEEEDEEGQGRRSEQLEKESEEPRAKRVKVRGEEGTIPAG